MIDAVQLQMVLLLIAQTSEEQLRNDVWGFMRIYAPELITQAYQRMMEVKVIQMVLELLSDNDEGLRHKKAQAIKLLREQFELGLKEAKDVCDAWIVYTYGNPEAVALIKSQYTDGRLPELSYDQKDVFELLRQVDELNDLKKSTL